MIAALLIGWLATGWLSRSVYNKQGDSYKDERAAWAFVLLLPALMVFLAPWIVWVALRNESSRVSATIEESVIAAVIITIWYLSWGIGLLLLLVVVLLAMWWHEKEVKERDRVSSV